MIEEAPKLSVILPTYNRGGLIKDTIESVLGQNYEDFELIIINDGSTDNTQEIVTKYQNKDSRVIYLEQKNKGEYATMNRGFSLARGAYITLVHSDDILAPDSLEARVKCLDNRSGIDIAHGDMVKVDMSGREVQRYVAGDEIDGKKILEGFCVKNLWEGQKTPLNYLTFMLRAEAVKKIGKMDETLRYAGDLDWMMRAMALCTFKRVPKVVYRYRRHKNAISKIIERENQSLLDLTRKVQLRHCEKLKD